MGYRARVKTRTAGPILALAFALGCGGGKPPSSGPEVPTEPAPVRVPETEPAQPAEPEPETKAEAKTEAEFPKADPELEARIKKTFGDNCRLERKCKDMLGIDCQAATDGPYYYVVPETLEKISTCGGACMGGKCTNCPPKEWTCAVY